MGDREIWISLGITFGFIIIIRALALITGLEDVGDSTVLAGSVLFTITYVNIRKT